MIQRLHRHPTTVLAVSGIALLSWFAADVAAAQSDRAGSTRSGSSSTRSSGSSSSGSSSRASSGSSSTSSSSASSGQRRAVPRSGSSSSSARSGSGRSHGNSGASRTRTRHDRHRTNRGRVSGGYGVGVGYGYGYGYGRYGYPYYWHPFWGYWGWYGAASPIVYASRPAYGMGALDLKVRPKNTEIYVDGQYVGLARQYDGFPGYLWLEKGLYDISFYKPGFSTEVRTVKVLTSLVLDMEIDMREGEAVKPELKLDEPVDRGDAGEEVAQRLRRSRPAERARLHLTVDPESARVYLDGEFLGTGEELEGLRAGLMLSAGEHTLEVASDGFETVHRDVVADAGEGIEIDFVLEPVEATAPR